MSTNNQIPQTFLLSPKKSMKKTLVLDLDETLVHSQFLPFSIKSDVILKIEIENQVHDIHVLIRPGVQDFLKRLSKLYEIVIFTASVSRYADPLLDILDKDNNCSFRLFREHCTMMGITYIKDLNKLGRDLKDVIIVDNSPLSYSFNKDNGLPILTWFNNKNDKELYYLLPILEFLSYVNDVRDYIKNIVIDDKISYENTINIIQNYSEINKDFSGQKFIDEIIFNLNNLYKQGNKENVNPLIHSKNNTENNGYINITISNNEINNYLYFSPIYTINNNNIKSTNANNDCFDNFNIKINNEYDKTENLKMNQNEAKNKILSLNSKTNRPKSKDIFNKINVKEKEKKKGKGKKLRHITLIDKNNIQKSIKLNNQENKSINNPILLNNSDSKEIYDYNIIDLKTLVSSKKNITSKNFRLPKTPEIEQILSNTNTKKKTINDLILNRIIYQTGRSTNNDINKNYIYRNTVNKLKHRIDLNINHEKHKSLNFTDLNYEGNFMSFKKSNINNNNLFFETKPSLVLKDNSLSKNKISNSKAKTKTLNNENIKISMNNCHKKTLSNQFKIVGIIEYDKTNKIKKLKNYNLEIQNSNSKRNNKLRKINSIHINRTINVNNVCNYSLKKFYNINSNNSKRDNQLNTNKNTNKKLFNPIFTNKIKKFVTNIKDFTDSSNTLRHKKTLSFNGDILPLNFMNRTNSTSFSKRILRDKSKKLSNVNNNINKNKNKLQAIKINVNDIKKKKISKIKKIKDIKLVNINSVSKNKNNKTDINSNIFLNKLFDNGNKFKKGLKINNLIKKRK